MKKWTTNRTITTHQNAVFNSNLHLENCKNSCTSQQILSILRKRRKMDRRAMVFKNPSRGIELNKHKNKHKVKNLKPTCGT